MSRKQALSSLTDMVANIHLSHPIRVGIDGVDVSGKTMLADELAELLQSRNRTVIRASIDGFHNPREVRYRQGRYSPQGYYDDSFNYDAVITHVLEPLGPGGNQIYKTTHFDFTINSESDVPMLRTKSDAILVFDGVFLHRPVLRKYWDFSVFVHTDFEITIKRAEARDIDALETPERVRAIYEQRYIPGQQIYIAAELPSSRANVIWNNNDIAHPELIVNTPESRP